jgi:hypothetical protein
MPKVPFDPAEGSQCPRRMGFVKVKGRRVPKRCWSNTCPVCGPLKALAISHATKEPEPNWFIRVHGLADDWDERRRFVNTVGQVVRRACAPEEFQWAWTVHPNDARDHPGHHLHALAKTDDDILDHFEYLAAEGDWFDDPEPYVEPVQNLPGASAYLLRLALDGEYERHLEANGGRYIHASRGYFDGGLKAALARERSRAFLSDSSDLQRAPERVIDTAEFEALMNWSG